MTLAQNQWLGVAPDGGGCVGLVTLVNVGAHVVPLGVDLFIASPVTGKINHLEFPVQEQWAWRETAMTIPGAMIGVTGVSLPAQSGTAVRVFAANEHDIYVSILAPDGILPPATCIGTVDPEIIVGLSAVDSDVFVLTTGGNIYRLVQADGVWTQTIAGVQIPGPLTAIAAAERPDRSGDIAVFTAIPNYVYQTDFPASGEPQDPQGVTELPSDIILALSAHMESFRERSRMHLLMASKGGGVRRIYALASASSSGPYESWNAYEKIYADLADISCISLGMTRNIDYAPYLTNVFAADYNGNIFALLPGDPLQS